MLVQGRVIVVEDCVSIGLSPYILVLFYLEHRSGVHFPLGSCANRRRGVRDE
jgi:hypothetical protein